MKYLTPKNTTVYHKKVNTEACLKATHLSEHHRTLEKQMHYHSGCLRILQNLHNTLEKKRITTLCYLLYYLPILRRSKHLTNCSQYLRSPTSEAMVHGPRYSKGYNCIVKRGNAIVKSCIPLNSTPACFLTVSTWC